MSMSPNHLSPDSHRPMEQVLYEIKKVIVGQDVLLERLLVALLARGHVLVEGVPGLAKTLTIKTLAAAVGGVASIVHVAVASAARALPAASAMPEAFLLSFST